MSSVETESRFDEAMETIIKYQNSSEVRWRFRKFHVNM